MLLEGLERAVGLNLMFFGLVNKGFGGNTLRRDGKTQFITNGFGLSIERGYLFLT